MLRSYCQERPGGVGGFRALGRDGPELAPAILHLPVSLPVCIGVSASSGCLASESDRGSCGNFLAQYGALKVDMGGVPCFFRTPKPVVHRRSLGLTLMPQSQNPADTPIQTEREMGWGRIGGASSVSSLPRARMPPTPPAGPGNNTSEPYSHPG